MSSATTVMEISPAEACAILCDPESPTPPRPLDCRTREEHAFARLENSLLIPMDELRDRLDELDADRNRTLIVYCHHGIRSLMVARFLRDHGFPLAVSLAGGIDRWSRDIDPRIGRY
jgi:rhodanese-related sulfurtransferase